MRNKKIHFIVGDINITGGVEKVTHTLSSEFVNRDAKVFIHSLYSTEVQHTLGVQVSSLGLIPPDRESNLFSKIKRLFINGLILRNSLGKTDPDSNFIFQGFYIATFLPFFIGIQGQKIVCEHNSYDAPGRISRIARYFLYKTFSPKLVVLTNSDEQKFIGLGISSVRRILNPLPHRDLPVSHASQNKNLVSLGRFTHQKRFDLMIDLMAPILRNYPDWLLKIQGAGEDYDLILSAVTRSGISNQIQILPQGDPQLLYQEGAIFLMTSLFEGLPMTLLESMSYGIPVVCFECSPGLAEVVEDDKNGYLVRMNDKQSFIDNVRKLMDDSNLRNQLGVNAQGSVEKYQLSKVMLDWEKLIL